MKFDKQRLVEFEILVNLIYDACELNSASNVIGRMERMIDRALRLSRAKDLRVSFVEWLRETMCQQHEQFIQEQAEENK